MEMDILQLTQLGGTVVTVGLFVWYLSKRDAILSTSMQNMTSALYGLNATITSLVSYEKKLLKVVNGGS